VSISTYTQFQAMEASEKEGLVILEASKRLMGWVVHSGSVYKLTGFDYPVFSPDSPIQDSGVALSSVGSIGAVIAGTYFHDRAAKILYLRTSDSVNPSGKFISMTFRMFFSMSGRNLPNDLSAGFDVHWLPLLMDTSDFGVALDNKNQLGAAIEGSGSIQLFNDQDFWKPIFDKYYFENQRVFVYSWNPLLPVTEAKLIYRGRIQGKTYEFTKITFQLADILNELRAPIPLSDMSSVMGARISDNQLPIKKRLLYGYVSGHRPLNIDQALDGYPLTGTFTLLSGTATLTGSSTLFMKQLSPTDEIQLTGVTGTVTIDSVASDTSATLTQTYTGSDKTNVTATIIPRTPKRWMNRQFIVSGHALREPNTTVSALLSTSSVRLSDIRDLLVGDQLVVNGELTSIQRMSGDIVKLSTTLQALPDIGSTVKRPSITNVFIDDRQLQYLRDYTYSASAGTLTLDELAEFNVTPVTKLSGTLSFTSGSKTVNGTSTFFTNELALGDWVRPTGQADWFEILQIVSDTQLMIRANSTYTASGVGEAKSVSVYAEGETVLSCDVLGATDDGLTTGNLLKRAPQIVKDILNRVGLSSSVDSASFTTASDLCEHRLALTIPETYTATSVPKARDVITKINQSVFGSLIQSRDFQLQYSIVEPARFTDATRLAEVDVLRVAIESAADRIVKTSTLRYGSKEYDVTAKGAFTLTTQAVSDNASYLANTLKENVIETYLVDAESAVIFAQRWALVSELASSRLKISTKMQLARSQIADRIELSHEKLYARMGAQTGLRVASVSEAHRSVTKSDVVLEDLANTFARCAIITDNAAQDFSAAPDRERLFNGYITDSYGMENNDPDTFGINLIW
jgi:hypothetical protein